LINETNIELYALLEEMNREYMRVFLGSETLTRAHATIEIGVRASSALAAWHKQHPPTFNVEGVGQQTVSYQLTHFKKMLNIFSQFQKSPSFSSPLDEARLKVMRRKDLEFFKSPSSVMDLTAIGEHSWDTTEPRLELEVQKGGIESVMAVDNFIQMSSSSSNATATAIAPSSASSSSSLIATAIVASTAAEVSVSTKPKPAAVVLSARPASTDAPLVVQQDEIRQLEELLMNSDYLSAAVIFAINKQISSIKRAKIGGAAIAIDNIVTAPPAPPAATVASVAPQRKKAKITEAHAAAVSTKAATNDVAASAPDDASVSAPPRKRFKKDKK